jgi:hypothetical protein
MLRSTLSPSDVAALPSLFSSPLSTDKPWCAFSCFLRWGLFSLGRRLSAMPMPAATPLCPGAPSSLSLSLITNGASTWLRLRFRFWELDKQLQQLVAAHSPFERRRPPHLSHQILLMAKSPQSLSQSHYLVRVCMSCRTAYHLEVRLLKTRNGGEMHQEYGSNTNTPFSGNSRSASRRILSCKVRCFAASTSSALISLSSTSTPVHSLTLVSVCPSL